MKKDLEAAHLPGWVIRSVLMALTAQLLLSLPLWCGVGRTFPALPLMGTGMEGSPGLLAVTLAFLLVAFLFPQKKWVVAGLSLWLVGLTLLDLNRLQPWLYAYLLCFAVFLFSKNGQAAQVGWQWLLAAVYCWSGFNKITPWFAEDNFPWMCEAFAWTKPLGQQPVLGYGIALFEGLLGLLLLWPRSRRAAVWAVTVFHAYIIASLLALGWNAVVIPWNLAMVALVWLVFSKVDFAFPQTQPLRGLLAFIWITPALCFLNLWPHPLSWRMYSNTQPEVTFYVKAAPECAWVQPAWKKHAFDAGRKLSATDWAMDELKVPIFAHPFAFRAWGCRLCDCVPDPDSAGIYILEVNPWRKSGEHWEKIPCARLKR